MNNTHGYDVGSWDDTKAEMRCILQWNARNKGTIPYSTLVGQVGPIRFQARDPSFWYMLGQISREEDADGRGMLTAVVVHQTGDQMPGGDFFELASELGRDPSDRVKCWTAEVNKVHDYWQDHVPPCEQPNTERMPTEEYRRLRRLERRIRGV